jgi:guanine deaminase
MKDNKEKFIRAALRMAERSLQKNSGGPFGCVIVKEGKILSRGNNSVTDRRDPTAHAEVMAIRRACRKLNSFQLTGCEMYCSCEPCPMCLGAIYWARPSKVYFAATRKDAAAAGFDDDFIYHEILTEHMSRKIPFEQIFVKDALAVFGKWDQIPGKIHY